MLKRILLLVTILFFASLLPAEARVYLDINAPTFVQIPIVLPKWKPVDNTPPTLSAKAYEILIGDGGHSIPKRSLLPEGCLHLQASTPARRACWEFLLCSGVV